ncbi:MAG: hypothetical protein HOV66_29215 [Streptomycetaceae bacterium]|nr:hypothetical protein [Streptomycetaceae bacterium]
MGLDDDEDCAGHVWVLAEVGSRRRVLDTASVCARCGTARYEPADGGDRPPL